MAMKAWQLTTGLAVLAIAAGQLPEIVVRDDAPPVRAQLDRVVGTVEYGFVGPQEDVQSKLRLAAIDAWIRDSRPVKTCFFGASQTLGYLPDVMVRLHVTSSGTIDQVSVLDAAQLQNTDFEACLSRALRNVTVPTYDGAPPLWLNYPFKF
jgi:hypothetical protein